jgi:putative transposase
MSKRSYTACYIYLIWGVKDRQLLLKSEEARIALRKFINQYVKLKKINLKIMFINPEHIHLLIELATNQTIEDIVKLIKGSSSHWINQNDIIKLKFA